MDQAKEIILDPSDDPASPVIIGKNVCDFFDTNGLSGTALGLDSDESNTKVLYFFNQQDAINYATTMEPVDITGCVDYNTVVEA